MPIKKDGMTSLNDRPFGLKKPNVITRKRENIARKITSRLITQIIVFDIFNFFSTG
jgi:hypothetical protein